MSTLYEDLLPYTCPRKLWRAGLLLQALAMPGLPVLLEHWTAKANLTYHKHVTLGAILLHHVPGLSQAADLSSLAQSVQEPTYETVFQRA